MNTTSSHTAAASAYQAGMSDMAAELYDACARQAERAKDIGGLAGSLRWKGNSLMWAGQPQESQTALLEAVSLDGHPEVNAGDIYGALTDLCLLSLQTQPLRVFRNMLRDAKHFLEKRGLSRWRHRTDNLEAIACYLRGRYEEAFQHANRAWQNHKRACDGPHYQDNGYLYYLFRSAHGIRDVEEMNRAMALLRQHAESWILTGRLRLNICEMLLLSASAPLPESGDAILALAKDTLAMQRRRDPMQEEEQLSMLVLAILGEPDKAELHLNNAPRANIANTDLLRLDIQLNKLGGAERWVPPHSLMASVRQPHRGPGIQLPTTRTTAIPGLLRAAEKSARAEDERMECSIHLERVAARKAWLVDHGLNHSTAQSTTTADNHGPSGPTDNEVV